jgi:hypothetical protein
MHDQKKQLQLEMRKTKIKNDFFNVVIYKCTVYASLI